MYVGDRIVTISINGMYNAQIPKSCNELTNRVAALVPSVMKANEIAFEFCEEESQIVPEAPSMYTEFALKHLTERAPYSYDVTSHPIIKARVEFDKVPRVQPGEKRDVKLTVLCMPEWTESYKLELRLILPEGWSCNGCDRTITLPYPQPIHGIYGIESTSFTITAGEQVDSVNRIYVEMTNPSFASPVIVPITFIG